MSLDLDVQYATSVDEVPSAAEFRRWAHSALLAATEETDVSLTVRITDEAEIADLNARYREVPQATNVLSFPMDLPLAITPWPLGDVVLCAPIVLREARAQGKPETAHWAHLTVHGVLHLLGHDHQGQAEAELMEGIERNVMAALGYPDPYAVGIDEQGPG